jgi:diaminopimelate epimerase
VDFVKMHGLGNDFVVVEGPRQVAPEEVQAWCDRRHGIGADGVLEVTARGDGRVGMRYWNADGAAAEMCGNGLRCVARLAWMRGMVPAPDFVVETPVGDRPVAVRPDGTVRALLGAVSTEGNATEVLGALIHPVTMDNPHAVLWVDDPAHAPVDTLGPQLEADAPNGVNVEFATVVAPDRIRLRVWERGVGETLACGTGAAATAYLAHFQGVVGSRVTVELPGGELVVDLDGNQAWIEGPAEVVFEGSVA